MKIHPLTLLVPCLLMPLRAAELPGDAFREMVRFEVIQGSVAQANKAGDFDLAPRLFQGGRVPAPLLEGAWPYNLSNRWFGGWRGAVEPPCTLTMFPASAPDMMKGSDRAALTQVTRTLGSLLGGQGAPPLLAASRCPEGALAPLAREFAHTFGGEEPRWLAALHQARSGVQRLSERAEACVEAHLAGLRKRLEERALRGDLDSVRLASRLHSLEGSLEGMPGREARLRALHAGLARILDQAKAGDLGPDPMDEVIAVDAWEEL